MSLSRIACWPVLASVVFGVGCSGETNVAPQPAPVDNRAFDLPRVFDAGGGGPTEKERAVASSYVTALAAPGFPQLGALLAIDVHYAFPGLGDGRGKDGAVALHDQLFGAFDGRSFALSRVWRTPSAQMLEWVMTGKQAREWMGVAPTGKPVGIEGATILWTNDDGSVGDIHVVFDTAVVKAQLGAGPSELASLPLPTPPAGPPKIIEQSNAALEAANLKTAHVAIDDDLDKATPEAYLDTLSDDVEVVDAEHAEPQRGKAAAKSWFVAFHKAVNGPQTVIDNSWAVDDGAVVEYTIGGPQVAPYLWIPPRADRPFELRVLEFIELHDGKLARIVRYDNPAQLLKGPAVPPPMDFLVDAGAKHHR